MDPPDCKRFWIPTNLSQFSNRVEFSPPTVTTSGFRFQGPRTFGGITAQHGIDEILLVVPRPFNDFRRSADCDPSIWNGKWTIRETCLGWTAQNWKICASGNWGSSPQEIGAKFKTVTRRMRRMKHTWNPEQPVVNGRLLISNQFLQKDLESNWNNHLQTDGHQVPTFQLARMNLSGGGTFVLT